MVKKIGIGWFIWLIGLFIISIPYPSYAIDRFEKVYIGQVESMQEVYKKQEVEYPLYQIKGQTFIAIKDLEAAGFKVRQEGGIPYIEDSDEMPVAPETITPITGSAYMAPFPVYCSNIRSYALNVADNTLIPIDGLKAMDQLKYSEGIFYLEKDFQDALKHIKIDEVGIKNLTDHIVKLKCQSLYWNGTEFERIEIDILLEAGENKEWDRSIDEKKLYVTTLIEEVNEWQIREAYTGSYGQENTRIFKQYSESIYLRELTMKFPPCIIEGQMKHAVGPFKEKDIVEIWRSEKRYYFSVKDYEGNKYQVPFESVHIIGEKGARIGKVSSQEIEDFATLSHVQSATDYLIWTDLYRQRTYVLKREGEKWQLEKSFICSTGKLVNPTPTGFYEVQYMIPYIGEQKGYRCKYALVFFRDYMYHSILFDKTGKYIKSGQYELGRKASHGCIRLSEKDSQWLYTHIPVKTTIWIR
ncbi:MAG: L,D-transpeptidase [Cellulosilyticum sp.]|nr:L,D-transpeptidase [Cellulosilyticum sp.]